MLTLANGDSASAIGAALRAIRTALLAARQQSATPAAPVQAASYLADVLRQYDANGIHIGSGLPKATCPCGLCQKVRKFEATPSATPADAASEADKRDATRYRWLRDSDRLPEEIDGEIVVGTAGGEDVLFDSALDKAIDAAIQRERQQGEVRA